MFFIIFILVERIHSRLLMSDDFIFQNPMDKSLADLVDYYFFIDVPVDSMPMEPEYVLPFPRITFGYFFDHPFLVTNHDRGQSKAVDMVISRVSTDKITVQPITSRIKIIGAHVRPYTLALLTKKPITKFPWLIDTVDLFGPIALSFKEKILECRSAADMFVEVERVFLATLLDRDLHVIQEAVEMIEKHSGNIKFGQLAKQLGLTDRALRAQFHNYMGCAPKEFIKLVQLKQSVYHMNFTNDSLTGITYQGEYFDQSHFIYSFKQITGQAPKALREKMPGFRFLQF